MQRLVNKVKLKHLNNVMQYYHRRNVVIDYRNKSFDLRQNLSGMFSLNSLAKMKQCTVGFDCVPLRKI